MRFVLFLTKGKYIVDTARSSRVFIGNVFIVTVRKAARFDVEVAMIMTLNNDQNITSTLDGTEYGSISPAENITSIHIKMCRVKSCLSSAANINICHKSEDGRVSGNHVPVECWESVLGCSSDTTDTRETGYST